MDFKRSFEFGLAWRAALLLATFGVLIAALLTPGLLAARIVALLALLWALYQLWRFVNRTNFEVARFVESVRFEDFAQRFQTPTGAGFDVLGAALDDALRTLGDRRAQAAAETHFLSVVVDDAPVGWADEIARLAATDPKSGGIALQVSVVPEELAADGDPDLLAQVAINLVRNAALATAHQPDRLVTLSAAITPGRRILLEVADNGPGIPPARRDDVFLPFYTTRADGNGVGLSFARQVVIAHGGTIAIDDAPGGGTLVRILL